MIKNDYRFLFLVLLLGVPTLADDARPNTVLILTDDQGYQDLGCFGSKTIKTPKDSRIDDNTLVVFTSDNGPWVETTHGMKPDGKPFILRAHSGNADPLRGWKMSAWDGGCRVPFIARWLTIFTCRDGDTRAS